MQAIYNHNGRTVAWLSYRDIYDNSGTYIGFIKGHGVYNLKSKYCGSIKQSVFRDINGLVVAFMRGAKSVSNIPSLKPSPSEPTKKLKPSLKHVGTAPTRKSDKMQWSKIDWGKYIT